MNPLTVLPAKARAYVYALLVLASLGFTAWQASDGDWVEAVSGVVSALVGAQALANTPTRDPEDI